jgi:FixH
MNWGNKILLVIIVFITGMLYLVYRTTQTNYELVEQDYYKQELRYQDVIDGAKSADALSSSIEMKQTDTGIELILPPEMKNRIVTGTAWFYCAYNAAKDKKFSLKPTRDGLQTFSRQEIAPGTYTVRINWMESGKNYYSEKRVTVL